MLVEYRRLGVLEARFIVVFLSLQNSCSDYEAWPIKKLNISVLTKSIAEGIQ